MKQDKPICSVCIIGLQTYRFIDWASKQRELGIGFFYVLAKTSWTGLCFLFFKMWFCYFLRLLDFWYFDIDKVCQGPSVKGNHTAVLYFLPSADFCFFSCNSESDESCKKHLGRVLSIWEERSVYENDVLEQLRQALCKYFLCVWRFSLLFEILFLWLLCFHLDGDRKVRKRTYEQIKVDENNCSPRSSPTDPPQVKACL